MMYVVAAAISTFVIGAVAVTMSRRRNKNANPTLGEHLFADSDLDIPSKLFLVPMNASEMMESSPRVKASGEVDFEIPSALGKVALNQDSEILPGIKEDVWLAPVTNNDDASV
jgi:hypothetical protein